MPYIPHLVLHRPDPELLRMPRSPSFATFVLHFSFLKFGDLVLTRADSNDVQPGRLLPLFLVIPATVIT